MITWTSRPWTNWEAILLRMYERRVKIFGHTKCPGVRPSYLCDGADLHCNSVRALARRVLISTTNRRDCRGRVVWTLTDEGRRLAKELLR